MIEPALVYDRLRDRGVRFFAGVPDSLLQPLCAYIEEHNGKLSHVIAANEGNAIAIAMGHYLATGSVPVVYMQNSGLGNAVNPLTSLADEEVYRIPMLLVIGWRGEPGVGDEPQHVKQGRITAEQLKLLGVATHVLEAGSDAARIIDAAMDMIDRNGTPVALLVRSGTFAPHASNRPQKRDLALRREEALERLLDLAHDALVVATTGKTSREVFEIRQRRGERQRDFLTVGGMGHASSIAFGVALGAPDRRVVCLDGDGAMLMHLGALPIIAQSRPQNLVHVVLNNAAHESVGGQPTVADAIDFRALAAACGYGFFGRAHDTRTLSDVWQESLTSRGPALLQVDVALGSRRDLGRPSSSPEANKHAFVAAIR